MMAWEGKGQEEHLLSSRLFKDTQSRVFALKEKSRLIKPEECGRGKSASKW